MVTDNELLELERLLYQNDIEDSRGSLLKYTETTFTKFSPAWFHIKYYDILDRFANKEIKNLIISMPPQHGKSEGSSRRLPSYIAGVRPDEKIALICYAATKAQKFGREVMSIMREREYKDIFPNVEYPERGYTGAKSNTNETRESINSYGSMKFVGVEGPLTGDPVDVLILDDLYKGWKEANSPVVQRAVWDWYISVADSRLHNDSQQLIVFTRWSDQDLIAKLEDQGLVIEWKGDADLNEIIKHLEPEQFLKINFPALKNGGPTKFDEREEEDALWPEKHSKRKLIATRSKDPEKFECLNQGNPKSKEGLLYGPFKTYADLPELSIVKNYTDTADTGKDFLCSIVYGVPLSTADEHIYILDLVYSDKAMEITEPLVIDLLNRNKVNLARVESNNGGRGFSRVLEAGVNRGIVIEAFHQNQNKQARIYSQSASVNRTLVFPSDWPIKWPQFYKHVTNFKKIFEANDYDDAPDTLTGILESEINGFVIHKTQAPKGLNFGG